MTDAPRKPDWNTRFDGPDYLFGTSPVPFLPKHGRHLPVSGTALAVADGEGRNSVWLAGQGLNVTAFDYAPNALAKARVLAADNGVAVDFRDGDVLAWNWAATQYDVVAGIFFQFLNPTQRSAVFRGFHAAVKPGGLLLLHGFAPRQVGYGTGGPPHIENMYTLPILHQAFAGYDVLCAEDYDEVIHSGSGHDGNAGLIDFVALKPKGD